MLPAVAAVVVVVAAALGAYFALSGGDGTSDTTAARQTVDKIYTALNAHDGAALQSLSCNRLARSLGTIDGTLNTVRDAAPTSGQTVTSGDARSTGTLIVTDTTNATARPMKVSFQLHLRKTGSRWCYSSLNATAHTPVGPAPPSAVGTSVTPGPSASTADPATVCHGLGHESQVLDLLVTAAVPAAADIMPISFVAPRSGTNVAYCRAFFRPEEAKRVAGVAVYSGVRMPQYVALLNSLSWRLITRSAVAPVYADQVGVHVTIVQSGPQLVLIASNPGR